MKKAFTTILAALAIMVFFSCNKEEKPASPGEEIKFSVISHEIGTKAQYSGQGVTQDGQNYERIDWQVGDNVRIVCPDVFEPASKYTDYYVKSVSNSGVSSVAEIDYASGNAPLRWYMGTHHFFSMYPCPGEGLSGIGLTTSGTATCVLPNTQTYATLTKSNGNYTAVVNPDYMYLVGYAATTPVKEGIQITYNPAFTAFQITVQNDFVSQSDMTVASAGLVTEGNVYLTGPDGVYQVNIDGDLGTGDISLTGIGSKEVMMNFSENSNDYITVAYGKTLTFTLLVQPGGDISKLSFKMVDKDGTVRTSPLKYRQSTDTDWVTFKAFHKSVITGLLAPETSKWYINLGGYGDVTLDTWDTWEGQESLNVTQVTLKETSLDLYLMEGNFYSNKAKANSQAVDGIITSYDIKINGEYNDSSVLGFQMDSSLQNYVTPSITLREGQTYNLHLGLGTAGTFSEDVTGTIILNDTSTNSWAHVDITIHHPNSSSPYFD